MMKIFFINLVVVIGFMSSSVLAEINEYKTDLYYANGMGMELEESVAKAIWESKIEKLKGANPQLKNTTPKIAYNSSTKSNNGDGIEDYFEVYAREGGKKYRWKQLSGVNVARLDNGTISGTLMS
jgi:hypothetical protein